jgi:transposase
VSPSFLPCDRDQHYLMPASLRDWLPEDHLAWFVLDAVSQMDLTAFYAAYRQDGWGRAAYEPAMLVALLLYAYCEGERSSRQIERRCREDIAFRVLAANQAPDHATVCRFRQQHEQALAGLFVEVLRLCAEAGLLRVGVVALDGTKLRADASREQNRASAEIDAEVRRILAEAERVDAEENARFSEERGDELPPDLRRREERLARLRAAKERLAARERERQERYEERLRQRAAKDPRGRRPQPPAADAEAKVNLTDPESRVVRDYHGYFQGYNVQAAATCDQIIVAAEVTRAATDVDELHPMIEAANRHLPSLGRAPIDVLLADAGYYSDANVRGVGAEGPELVIATRNDRNRRQSGPPPRGRIPAGLSLRERMARKLATKRGRQLYERRRWMIEPVFGDVKENRGTRRFMRRGFAACASEWKLVAATHNLRKLYRRAKASGFPRPDGCGSWRAGRGFVLAAA